MKKVLLFLFCFSTLQLAAQEEHRALTAILFDYTHQFPMADLQESFGDNSSIGISVIRKTTDNWLFGMDGSYIFGEKVKNENLFYDLTLILGKNYIDLRSYRDALFFQPPY